MHDEDQRTANLRVPPDMRVGHPDLRSQTSHLIVRHTRHTLRSYVLVKQVPTGRTDRSPQIQKSLSSSLR
jgi:hypothetical protein